MEQFKILNSLEESFYFQKINSDDESCYFSEKAKKNFIEKYHSDIKQKSSGLTVSDSISVIIVGVGTKDEEFNKHIIKITKLIKKGNQIRDANRNRNYEERGCYFIDGRQIHEQEGFTFNTVYHNLPDGKIIEYYVHGSYQEELDNIYDCITKIKDYHKLSELLPSKESGSTRFKI